MPVTFHLHDNGENSLPFQIVADVDVRGNTLRCDYRVIGDTALITWPAQMAFGRADQLWLHTCFECFFYHEGLSYAELNVSPSTQWNVYRFAGYRVGMKRDEDFHVVTIEQRLTNDEYTLSYAVERLSGRWPDRLRLNLAVILRGVDGREHFWSLYRGSETPDFHDGKRFVDCVFCDR